MKKYRIVRQGAKKSNPLRGGAKKSNPLRQGDLNEKPLRQGGLNEKTLRYGATLQVEVVFEAPVGADPQEIINEVDYNFVPEPWSNVKITDTEIKDFSIRDLTPEK
ncbi:MAG TPA: hypothetical protein PKX15_00315 [Bacteroidales bacterium]|nr:hypothetical protein [Bacteroidales bacterium]